MKFLVIFLILIGFAGLTSFTLISAYGDGKTISGDYTSIANGIISLDGDLFFISKSFAIQTEANIVESFHGVNFTIPYDPNPPVPGGIRSTTIVFSDGITEKLSRGMSSDIETTLSNHIWPIAGFSRHLDNTFYFLVSIDSESPLKQFKSGIPIDEIQCKKGLVFAQKGTNGNPICVKPESQQKLIERGWAVSEPGSKVSSQDTNSELGTPPLQIKVVGEKQVRRGTTQTIEMQVIRGSSPIEGARVFIDIEDYGEDIIKEFKGYTDSQGYFVFSWEIPQSFDDVETLLAFIDVTDGISSKTELFKFQVYCLPGEQNCKVKGN